MKNFLRPLLIFFVLTITACTELPAPPTATVTVTATAKATNTITPTATSTVTATATNTVTPTATITPTPKPQLEVSRLEVITRHAATGDGANNWGSHKTRIVRTADGVFTAYTIPGPNENNAYTRRWQLVWQRASNDWVLVAEGIAGREPVNLLVGPDDTLYIVGWPNRKGTLWSGKFRNGRVRFTKTLIPDVSETGGSYAAAGISPAGHICVFSNKGFDPAETLWACYLPGKDKWYTDTLNVEYRHVYAYVFPQSDGGLSVVATRDVLWSSLGYTKPDRAFGYVFNAYTYWHSDRLNKEELQVVEFRQEKPTKRYPNVSLDAQNDVYLDDQQRMHIIYWRRGPSTEGKTEVRHRLLNADGKLVDDVLIPAEAGRYCRIFQDANANFYLICSAGLIYPAGKNGLSLGKPTKINLSNFPVEYSGFHLSVPRTGTQPSNQIDVVFPTRNGRLWVYFRITMPNIPLIEQDEGVK